MALTDVDVPNVRGRSLLAQVDQGSTAGLSTGEDGDELYSQRKRMDNGDSQRHEIFYFAFNVASTYERSSTSGPGDLVRLTGGEAGLLY